MGISQIFFSICHILISVKSYQLCAQKLSKCVSSKKKKSNQMRISQSNTFLVLYISKTVHFKGQKMNKIKTK